MSRNLGQTHCYCCGESKVALVEEKRPITECEAGHYFSEYEGMLVANAECRTCEAEYLAWVEWARHSTWATPGELGFFDLSFRSTFNDEPGEGDTPDLNGGCAKCNGTSVALCSGSWHCASCGWEITLQDHKLAEIRRQDWNIRVGDFTYAFISCRHEDRDEWVRGMGIVENYKDEYNHGRLVCMFVEGYEPDEIAVKSMMDDLKIKPLRDYRRLP